MYSCIVWLVTIIAAPRGLEGFVEGDSELDVVNVAPEEVDDGLRFAGVLELGFLPLLRVAELVLPPAALTDVCQRSQVEGRSGWERDGAPRSYSIQLDPGSSSGSR